jgi:citrate synthase
MAAEIFAGATDKGLEGVVACTTGISSIMDVTLCYRGYTIEQLAENSTFEEVVYLLWNDKLPGAQDLQAFQSALRREMALEPAFVAAVRSLPTKGVHPCSRTSTPKRSRTIKRRKSASLFA